MMMLSGTELTVMPPIPSNPRRQSSFFLFAADHAAEVSPSKRGRGGFLKQIGRMWRKTDAETKKMYQVKFIGDYCYYFYKSYELNKRR